MANEGDVAESIITARIENQTTPKLGIVVVVWTRGGKRKPEVQLMENMTVYGAKSWLEEDKNVDLGSATWALAYVTEDREVKAQGAPHLRELAMETLEADQSSKDRYTVLTRG